MEDKEPEYLRNSYLRFSSRRSPVICLHGAIASSQSLASEAGYKILKLGGNAADAAVAVAAALNVTEPGSTGLGGDCFALFYDADAKTVKGINGRYSHFYALLRNMNFYMWRWLLKA